MRTNRLWVFPAVAGVALGGYLLFGREAAPGVEVSSTPARAQSAPKASGAAPHTVRPSARAAAPVAEAAVDPVKQRTEKVQAALEKFRRQTDGITVETVTASMERVTKAKEIYAARPTPAPKVEPFQDEHGQKWNRLTYENGEVLYELAGE